MKLLNSKGSIEGKDSVFIAVPSYGGICAEFVYSLWASREELAKAGIRSDLCIFDGNCHVDDSRNRLVKEFLESDCEQMVFLDTDLQWDAVDLVKLVQSKRDVVAGIYPLKQEHDEYPVRWLKSGELWSEADGLIEVESVPTGFLKLRRWVLESISKTVPWFVTRQERKKLPLIFERTMVGYQRYGGDYEFCRKWRALGGKIYIDPEMRFSHMGSGEWDGCLGTHLRRENGLSHEYMVKLVNQMCEHPPTPEEISRLIYEWGNKWAAPAELITALALIAEETEGPILECGSGVSTLVLGAIAKRTMTMVTTLEHDSAWMHRIGSIADKTELMYPYSLIKLVKIKDGWYDFDPGDKKFTLVLVDGPTREIGRSGLLRIKDSFAPGCIFIVDDAEEQVTEDLKKIGVNFTSDHGRFVIGRLEAPVDTEQKDELCLQHKA